MTDLAPSHASHRPVETSRDSAALRHTVVVALLVAAGYYLTAKIGFAFALQPGSVSTLWMPNSILLAGLLLVPRRSWWIIIVAACPAHLAAEIPGGVPAALVLPLFLSNSFQALFGAFFISCFVDDGLRFEGLRDLTVFLFFGAFLAPFLTSFLDVAVVRQTDLGSNWQVWRVRCFSNILATLTIVPVILTWVSGGFNAVRNALWWRYVEAGVLTAGLFAVGLTVFSSQQGRADTTPSLLYWPLPFLLWATVRFGPRGVSTALMLVMFLAIGGATHGQGPFVANSAAANALSIQWFLIVVSIPLMALAAVIEERRRADWTLRESEDRYRSVVESQTELICRFLPDTTLTYVNDAYCRYFGKSREELLGRQFIELLPASSRSWAKKMIESLVQNPGAVTNEHEVILPDGRIGWQQWVDHAIPGPNGEILELQAIGRDITERKRVEQALQESSERNQAILRAFPDLMFLQNKEGVFLEYYARDSQDLVVPPESFLGKNIREVLPAELAERIMEAFEQLDGTVEAQVLEYSLGIANEVRHFEARIVSAEGEKFLTIVRNVTEARRAADALRNSEEKLLISNRESRELAARVITAQESERRRIALLLHDDLSQNIAAAGMTISRLKLKPPATNELLAAELDRLGAQTNDLATQIRRLSHQLHPDVLEHVGLVAALESELAEFGHNERIKVEFKSDIQSEQIPLDVSVCLYRVAIEALRNVSKHSGASSASVALAEDDVGFTLEVSDSGQGFDVERVKRGSGLGLISAEERVKLLQGSFLVRSKPEGGTVLLARIPLPK